MQMPTLLGILGCRDQHIWPLEWTQQCWSWSHRWVVENYDLCVTRRLPVGLGGGLVRTREDHRSQKLLSAGTFKETEALNRWLQKYERACSTACSIVKPQHFQCCTYLGIFVCSDSFHKTGEDDKASEKSKSPVFIMCWTDDISCPISLG